MKTYKEFIREDFWDIFPPVYARKLKRAMHGKQYAAALKDFLDSWKKAPKGRDKRNLAAEIARKYKDVETRTLIQYLNDLVKAGKMPKHLSLEEIEYEKEDNHEEI